MAHNAPAFLTRHARVNADFNFARAEVADPSQTLDPLPDELPPTSTLQGAELLQTYASATLRAVSAALVTPMALVGGSAGADSLTGTTSDDLLQGLGGNDTIDGAGGNDTVYGGESGNDIGSGDDSITTGSGNDVIYGQDGNDSILAGEGDDFIDAGDGNDTVWGHLGTDSIYGGDGNDALSAFGPGVENLPGSGSQDGGGGLIDGGAGDDAIAAIEVDGYNVPYESPVVYSHVAIGGDGNDRIDVGGYDRLVYGDLQDPQAVVSSGNDFIRSYTVGILGGPGGSVPRSAIYAGPGNDTIECSNADFSTIDGGGGDDLITSLWDGQSTLIGGAGADSLSATFSNGDFGNPFESRGLEKTRLDGGSGNDNLRVDSNVDTNGGQTEITLLGGDDADSLTAQDSEADNNASRGMAHVTLDGGNGNDVLSVSGGLDVWLTGGAGRDTFVVTQAQYLTQTLGARLFENLGGTQTSVAAGPLQITDFQSGTGGDVLDLSSVLAGSAVGYVAGSNPFTSGHLSALQVGADTHIVFDPDGESAGAANPMTLAVLQSVSTSGLVAANFLPSPNLPPSGTDAVLTLQEDQTRALSVADFGFTDPNAGDALASVTLLSLPERGQLLLAGSAVTQGQVIAASSLTAGQLIFRPGADENNGGATLYAHLGFTVSDGSLSSTAHNLTFSVSALNDAPRFVGPAGQALITAQGKSLTFSSGALLSGWVDVDSGDIIQAVPLSASTGSLQNLGGGNWTFTPPAGFAGDVELRYSVVDRQNAGATGTTTIRVTPNQSPTAVNDSGSNREDNPITGNVLSNDSDADGNGLSVTGFRVAGLAGNFTVGTSANITGVGSLRINADGSYVFSPSANFNGVVPVATYTVSDGLATATATLALSVEPVNDAPTLVTDTGAGDEGSLITGNVLGNDSDVDGNTTLSVTSFSITGQPASFAAGATATITGVGTLLLLANGSYTFTPVAGFNGAVPLVTYTASDGSGTANASASTTLALVVNPVNDAPTAVNDTNSGKEDTPITGNVLSNDSDLEGNRISVTGYTVAGQGGSFSAEQAANIVGIGNLIINANGSYTFNPASNFHGVVPVVTYTVSDGLATATATLALSVEAVNDAPTLLADTGAGADGSLITGNVLGNDSDVDGNTTLSVTSFNIEGQPASFAAGATATITGVGTLLLLANGSYTFTPLVGFSGAVPLVTYTANDGSGAVNASSSSTLTLTVSAVNDAPVAINDSAERPEDTPITGNVLSNDSDPDGNSLSVTGYTVAGVNGSFNAGQTANIVGVGNLIINANGSYTFNPVANFNGIVPEATYTVSDGSLSDSATLNLSLSAVNDNPVFVGPAPSLTAFSGQPLVIQAATLMTGFVDPDVGDFLQVESASANHGSMVLNNDGTWTYTASVDFTGPADLTVQITDLHGGAAQTTFQVQVQGNGNQAPTLVQPMPDQQAAQDWAFSAPLPEGMFTDADSAGYTLSASLAGGAALPAWLTFNATTRTFSGTPTVGFASANKTPTPLNIVVTATDTEGASTTDAFVLTVNWTRVVTGTSGNDAMNGTIANETLQGANGNDTIQGNGGLDSIIGGGGNDSLVGGINNDTLLGQAGSDTLLGGAGNDRLFSFIANARDPSGNFSDRLEGGAGDDLYEVDSAGDQVIENLGEGLDTVRSWVTFTLSQNVEALQLLGTTEALNGFGNGLDNGLTGNAGNNRLEGGDGNDTLTGGLGSDTLVGGAGNDRLFGLVANASSFFDWDRMEGGAGDDLYQADSRYDVVVENLNDGIDTVQSITDFVLPDHVENIELQGSSVVSGVGNSLDNVMVGNSNSNNLDGREGADSMYGGGGNDVYHVDNPGDTVNETPGGGALDRVYSMLPTYVLPDNVEILELVGILSWDGTGNSLRNMMWGNELANRLDGASGADTMWGYGGDDTFVVDNISDGVYAGDGIDLVESTAISYTLSSNAENLTLMGTANIAGAGNALANRLQGNSGNNTLNGAAGTDWIVGGAGNDSLIGGTGGDTFVFDAVLNATTNLDRISDFNGTPAPVTGEQDHIWLDDAVFTAFTGLSSVAASALRSGAGMTTAVSVDHRLIYNTTTGALYYDPDGVGGTAATQFALLTNRAVLDNTDFQVG